MNRKILFSVGAIAFVAALALGATGAFFSDSETSTGNTFTAGALDLKVDSTSHYDGLICQADGVGGFVWAQEGQATTTRPELIGQPCSGTWELKDLVPTQDHFFNFADVKPGDSGENTVSLHVDNNPAYACVDIKNIQNLDNTVNGPEILAGDVASSTVGELGQNLNFIVWLDNGAGGGVAGDNIWNGTEPMLTSGTAPSTDRSYTLAAPPSAPLPGGSTGYLGVEWCAGTWSSNTQGATCNGASMGNITQTDSYSADVSFRVEQARNNSNFSCNPVQPESIH